MKLEKVFALIIGLSATAAFGVQPTGNQPDQNFEDAIRLVLGQMQQDLLNNNNTINQDIEENLVQPNINNGFYHETNQLMQGIHHNAIQRGHIIQNEMQARQIYLQFDSQIRRQDEYGFLRNAIEGLSFLYASDPNSTSLESDLAQFLEGISRHIVMRRNENLILTNSQHSLNAGALSALLLGQMRQIESVRDGSQQVFIVRLLRNFLGIELLMAGDLQINDNGQVNLHQLPENVMVFNPLRNEHVSGRQNAQIFLLQYLTDQNSVVARSAIPQRLVENEFLLGLLGAYHSDFLEGDLEFSQLHLFLAKKLWELKKGQKTRLNGFAKNLKLQPEVLLKMAKKIAEKSKSNNKRTNK